MKYKLVTYFALACALAGIYLAFTHKDQDTEFSGYARVIDGDTIEVDHTVVRMIGVNSPETVDPDQPVECGGEKASADTKKYLSGEYVTVVIGKERTDYYGRTLGYVYVNGEEYNVGLVRRGDAEVDTVGDNTEHKNLYAAGQTEAQTNNVGLWKECK